MASELAIYYTPMHFMWGLKSGATPVTLTYKILSRLYLGSCKVQEVDTW